MPKRRSPVLISVASIALATGYPGSAATAEPPQPAAGVPAEAPVVILPHCPEEMLFDDAQPVGPPIVLDDSVEIFSDGLRADALKNATLKGNVELRQGSRSLRADEVQVDAAANSAQVRGSVEYHDPDLIVKGSTGSLVNGEAQFEGAQFELPRQPARGAARSMSLNRSGVLKLEGVRYTTCPPGSIDWQIKARSVSLDTNRRVGTARGARVEFLGVASYHGGTSSSGAVQITQDLRTSIEGHTCLIVEDIVDTGLTMDYLTRTLRVRGPRSIRIASLLDKPTNREIDVSVDYVGFTIPDEFVVGFGLDLGELYRNLPYVAVYVP